MQKWLPYSILCCYDRTPETRSLIKEKKSEKSSMAEESMDGEGLFCCVIL